MKSWDLKGYLGSPLYLDSWQFMHTGTVVSPNFFATAVVVGGLLSVAVLSGLPRSRAKITFEWIL
jgi:hypothetical protein